MRMRTQLITNLKLKDRDIKSLSNGYRVYKRANGHAHCLIPIQKAQEDKKRKVAEKLMRQITRAQARLANLKVKTIDNYSMFFKVTKPAITGSTRKYIKKNAEYWKKRAEYMRKHSPLFKEKKIHSPSEK